MWMCLIICVIMYVLVCAWVSKYAVVCVRECMCLVNVCLGIICMYVYIMYMSVHVCVCIWVYVRVGSWVGLHVAAFGPV